MKKRNYKPAVCIGCGIVFERKNSRQLRCEQCQCWHRHFAKAESNRKRRQKIKQNEIDKISTIWQKLSEKQNINI